MDVGDASAAHFQKGASDTRRNSNDSNYTEDDEDIDSYGLEDENIEENQVAEHTKNYLEGSADSAEQVQVAINQQVNTPTERNSASTSTNTNEPVTADVQHAEELSFTSLTVISKVVKNKMTHLVNRRVKMLKQPRDEVLQQL